MIKLADGVHTWGYFNAEKKYNFNGFLFSEGGKAIVVDPPPLSADDKGYFDALGIMPEAVLITNRNHLRDYESWKLPLALHKAEVDHVDVKPATTVDDSDVVGPGLQVIHLPGKSPGEFGLYWKERRLLMLGDAIIAPQGNLRLIPEAKLDDPAMLRRSLKKITELEYDVLLLADGDPILQGAAAHVAAFVSAL